MPSLPLKAQVAIRDQWTDTASPVQKAFVALAATVGYPVFIEPEWALLVAELDSFYEDKGYLVTTVCGVVEAWCRSLTELLEDESNEEWAETVLDKCKRGQTVRVLVEVAPATGRKASGEQQVSTRWEEERGTFVVVLPRRTVQYPTECYPVFRGTLLNCFDSKKSDLKKMDLVVGGGGGDDWADVEMDSKTGKAAVVEKQPPVIASAMPSRVVDILPTVQSLPRPDELLFRPPYHLIIQDVGRQRVEVHGSHSPSLQLIGEYLKKWCRVNHSDSRNPPVVDVKLEQSPWGLGLLFDRLVLTTEETRFTKQYTVNPCIVLALVEGALGYKQVHVGAGQWVYRRDTEFK